MQNIILMKKITCINFVFIVLFLLLGIKGTSQTFETFAIRKNIEVNGSMLVIGNNILGKDNLPSNDDSINNQDISMQYIDIDGDNSTFSSSSAELIMPTQPDGSATTCYRMIYAGLYWGAVLQSGSRADINKVKLKLPRSVTYEDINGEIIYDAIASPIPAESGEPENTPYACYADVTNLLSGLSNDIAGDYTLANVTSSEGFNGSTGLSAGWTLVVIFENPNLNMKSFTTFDGFSHIYDSHTEDIPITGFTTPQAGSINLQYAYAALDGDKTKRATKFELNGKEINSPLRPANKFFGSVIENTNGVSNPRNPSGTNTLGYDTGFLEVKNAEPEYIKNNDSSADLTLQVAKGQADPIFLFFSAFAVDIIAPDINLTKIVVDAAGDDIDGQDVVLGQNLFYEIIYQSVGSDNVTQFTLKDVLPDNVVFDPSTGIDLSNAGGATLQSYDAATRTLIFDIPDGSVEINDPQFVIRLAVEVVPNCYDLSQACSNEITNQAFATYSGIINTNEIVEEGSFASVECLTTPAPTNFLVDISNCIFERDEVLCGSSVVLTASDGYDSYSWSTSSSGTPVISTDQTYTATETGTYYVRNTTSSTCVSINETINVIPYGNTIVNPIIPFADILPICPNDGKVLPNIFLCGANDTREINTGISDAVSIIWEKLDETSCADVTIDDCANENSACTWNQVATGPNYAANTSGQFRIVINYPGGCFSIFYFDVFQNLLNPTATSTDFLCDTLGSITVGGVPTGYEYSIDGTNYQLSNNFLVPPAGYYTIYIRQIDVDTNPCIFEIPDIYIRNRDFSVTSTITQPNCNGYKGSIKLAVNDALPQYYYSIYEGATLVNSVGPIIGSDYTFDNLNDGTYTVNVSTDDGCVFTEDIVITEPAVLTATSALTTPLTCEEGEITIYPVGGTPPYLYYINSTTDFQNTALVSVPTSSIFNITVVDSNNCSAQTSITVDEIPAPVFNMTKTDVLCYGNNSGEIQFDVSNANGYVVEYSIDNGTTYSTSSIFPNLIAGTYPTMIKYSLNGVDCFSAPQDIIISEPAAAVTATAGVSKLAGCGPSGEGAVRITNPQGGLPPYEYSFDNQATWTNTNEEFLAPGTYTLYIRDANGCTFPTSNITVDAEPIAPTIAISDPDFNCDGSANSTVTVTNSGSNSFTYTYLIDNIENPNTADPTTFLNVSDGSHTVSVVYQLQTVPTFSNLLNETFGYGEDTSSPGMNPVYYCFERQVAATQCKGNIRIQDGDYSVTSSIVSPYGVWVNPVDHTPATNPPTAKGRYLVVNIGATIPATETLYEKQINDIIPNQPINVEFFAMNLLESGNNQANADLRVALVDATGAEISSFSTGGIPKTETWENYAVSLNPGANTSLKFIVRSNVQLTSGNDVAIDDIRVFQLPTTCTTRVDFPIVISTGNAFDASIVSAKDVTCSGASDGEIEISAQNFDPIKGFQYSLDNGTTWITQSTSPHTITGLPDGNQDIQIRYEDAADTCIVPLNQNISTPTPVSVSVSATPITCLDGSTITATGSGGTPFYSYELLDSSLNLVSNFPSNGILTSVVAGDYIIRVTDTNGCTGLSTPLNLVDPTSPTATIINADYCYDSSNGASLEVSASGGQAPYQYNINGSAFTTNPVFNNLSSGIYTIIVRDAYGCTFTLPAETIEPQVTINASLTKELDCTLLTPDATITGTIGNGYPPYEYAVSIDGVAYTDLGPIGTSFTYTPTTAGTYQFRVTDNNDCERFSNVITVNSINFPTATTTVVNPSCNGDANGSVQIIPANGVGTYEYSFDGSVFTTTALYPGLSAGTYAYEVRDSKDCVFSSSVTLTEPTVLVASATATAFSCNASNAKQSALVTIDVPTTGTAPYQYSFNGSGYSSSNTLTVNDNGTNQTITYSVRDANGCLTAVQNIILTALNPPTIGTIINTPITCNVSESTSTVTVLVSSGTGIAPFAYEIISGPVINTTGAITGDFSGLSAGTYIFKVTDANGCFATKSHIILDRVNIDIVDRNKTDVLCNGDNTGFASYTVSNFTGTYSYSINSATAVTGQTSTVINLPNLIEGTYTVVVTDEITGCTDTTTQIITEPVPFQLNLTSNINANCNNLNAIVTVNVDAVNFGTPGNYTYAFVEDGVTPSNTDYTLNNIANLNPTTNSDWDVYAKDINGCVSSKLDVAITTAPLPVIDSIVITDQCTGTITTGFTINATASGGVGTLEFSIGGTYNTTGIFTGVPAGTYTLTVKDANNCIETQDFTINEPLTAQASLTKDLTCAPAPTDATILITAANGNGPYTYTVTTAPATYTGGLAGNLFSTDTPGTYGFTVTDSNSCSRVTNTVTIAPIIYPDITSVSIITPITCNGDLATVQVNYDTTFGVAPFTFSYTNTAGTLTGNNTTGIFNLPADIYTFTITDNKGCTDIETPINIPEPAVINAIVEGKPITCTSVLGVPTSLGSVEVTSVSGGTGPYDYYITGPGYTNFELDHLGTSPFTFDVINFGIYQVNIVDDNGCTVLKSDVVVASAPDDLDIDVTSLPVDCAASSASAIVSIGASSSITGSGPFYFAIYDGSVPNYPTPLATGPWLAEDIPLSKSATFNGLIPGVTYTFIVFDADILNGGTGSGCYYYETATQPVNSSSTLDIALTPSNNFTCTGSSSGNVSFEITSIYAVDTNITYEILDALTLNVVETAVADVVPGTGTGTPVLSVSNFGNLPFGDYIVLIEETSGPNMGCGISSTRFNIAESAVPVDVVASLVKDETCNDLGVVTAIGSNGTAPYEFIISTSATSPAITDTSWDLAANFSVAAGTHYVHIKDAFNCIATSLPVVVDIDTEPIIALSTPDACAEEGSFAIEVNLTTAGIANYTLQLDSNAAISISSFPYTFNGLNSGAYTVTITDANGCTDVETITLVKKLSLNPVVTKELDCTANPDAEITLNLSDGTSVFTYLVEIDGTGGFNPATITGGVYTATTAGSYVFRVIDSNSCQFTSLPIVIEPITNPVINSYPTEIPSCPLSTDGTVTINATGGEPALAGYTYTVTQTLPIAGTPVVQIGNNYFTGLGAGTYSIEVRDAKNCSDTDTFTITDPTPLAFDPPTVDAYSCSATNVPQPAKVTVNVTPGTGTPPYKYNFDGGSMYYDAKELIVIDNGFDQTINYYVQDSKGCTADGSIIVPAFQNITDINFTIDRDPTCPLPTADVSLIVVGGATPIAKYEIISPTAAILDNGTNNTFLNLTPNVVYLFKITDANGCSYEKSFEFDDVEPIVISGQLFNSISCNPLSGISDNGEAKFVVSDFSTSGNYSITVNTTPASLPYTLSQLGDEITLSDLSSGIYEVEVTDLTTNCSDSDSVTIPEPTALTLTLTTYIKANCNFGAQVSVTAGGGTPNYTYAFVEDGQSPIGLYASSDSAVLDPATNTDWDVWVMDANGCTEQIDIEIDTDDLPIVTVPALASNQCNLNGNAYTFDVLSTTGIAPFTYSIGNGFQSGTTFTVASPGDYFVTVRDANGCETTSTASVTVYPALDLSPSVTTLPSCADDDGVITMTGSGGSGNYVFTINSSAASISYSGTGNNIISGVPAGTYTVTIEDTITSCTRNIGVIVDAPTPVTFTLDATPVSCNGFDDGTITVNLPTSNDNPIYTYSLDGGVTTQTSNIFSGLVAGNYNVTVTSGRNCFDEKTINVGTPSVINVPTPMVVEYACTVDTNSTNFATITVNGVNGGSLNYTIYEFIKGGTIVQANASNVYTEADLSGGTYTINVYDDNGCVGSTTADIQPFIRLDTLDVTVDNAITCTNDEDITVSVTSAGGMPTNLEYTVKSTVGSPTGNNYDQTNTNGIFTSLPIGNYLVTVLNLDTNCSLQTTHYVNEPNTFDLTVDNVVDVTCFNDSDGSVDVTFMDRSPTPTDESGAFGYDLFDNLGNLITSDTSVDAGPITISGLVSGTYTITASLVNTPFCTISKNFTVTAPTEALAISETHTEITCIAGNNDGTISASATGGWPGDYEYELELIGSGIVSTYSSIFNFTGLTAGDYTVRVKDSKGCVATTDVLLEIPDPIDAEANETPSLLSCFGDTNASITVSNVSGGQESNYTYTLNMVSPTPTSSGPQTSQVFNGLGAGTYNVTVRDGYNCEFTTEDVVITEPTAIEATLVKATSQTCGNRATLTLSATGGTGLYEYSETANFTTVLSQFATDITFEVDQGTYQYYVRDANACEPAISNEITIEPFIDLDLGIDETNATINCTGDLTGIIVANATGGLGDYTYILQDEFDTDITPAPTQNSPGVFTELPAGIYQVRVSSGVDCEEVSRQVEITQPDSALQVSFSVTDVACSGGDDGVLEITANGGTGIIKYAISPQLNQFFDSPIFEGLSAGTYQAIAQDELGCYVLIDDFVVDEPEPVILGLVPNSIIPEACVDELDGAFSVDISGGNLPYSVSLDDINGTYTTGTLTQTEFDFDDLAGGDHIVYVRDNLGCESEWNISFPESVRINTALDIAYCTDNLSDASVNMLTVMVDETLVNLSDLDYSLDGATFQLDNTFANIPPGDHYVIVRHTNTCEVIVDFEVEQFDPLQISIADGNINEIIASTSGGSGVYEYELQLENSSNSESFTNTNTFIIYESGNYTVTVTDSSGCSAVATAFFEYIDVCIDNYFTPNNDNRQDEWGPGCTDQYPNMTVAIFDRYGRKVYDLRVGQTWDGTYKGKNLPSGDYWYVLKLNDQRDDREFVGHFTLYR